MSRKLSRRLKINAMLTSVIPSEPVSRSVAYATIVPVEQFPDIFCTIVTTATGLFGPR
jgi:hypothetical protein